MKNIFLSIFLSRNGRGMFFLASNVENLQFNLLCGRVDGKGSNVAIVLLVGENFPQKVSRKVNFQNFSKRKNDNKKIRSLWVWSTRAWKFFWGCWKPCALFSGIFVPASRTFLSRACAFLAMFRVLVTSNVSRLMAQFSAARPWDSSPPAAAKFFFSPSYRFFRVWFSTRVFAPLKFLVWP